jgi:hypothetical protein
MAQQFFRYSGPATNGATISWLTFDEAMELQKKEDEMVKKKEVEQQQQQSDAALAPSMNKAVSDYAQERGMTQGDLSGSFEPKQYAKGGEKVMVGGKEVVATKGMVIPRTGDAISQAFSDIQANNEDTTELENILTQVSSQRTGQQQTPIATETSQQSRQQGLRPDVEQVATQPKGNLQSLMGDLPEEIIRPLLIQYNAGDLKPSQLLTEIKKAKDAVLGIKRAEKVAKASNEADIAKQEKVNEGSAGAQEVAGEYDIAKSELDNASAERIIRIKAATEKEKIDAKNAYSERTTILKPPQQEHIISYQNALNAIDAVNNLFDPKFVGLIDNIKGNISQGLGILGTDETSFKTAIANIQNITLKDRSGTAVTVPEFERFKKEVIRTQSQPKQFMATLKRMKDFTQNELSTSLDIYSRTKQDISGFEDLKKPIQTYGDDVSGNQQPGKIENSASIIQLPKDDAKAEKIYNALDPGDEYIDPDGKRRRKPVK